MWRPSRGPSGVAGLGAGERLGDAVAIGLADREVGLTVGPELVALVKDTKVIRLDGRFLEPGEGAIAGERIDTDDDQVASRPCERVVRLAPAPTTMRKSSPNRVRSSRSQLPTSPAGGAIRTRRRRRLVSMSRMYSPAMIVLPAPGSSPRRNRRRGWGSMWSYTAIRWCGSGSIIEISVANAGLNRWP